MNPSEKWFPPGPGRQNVVAMPQKLGNLPIDASVSRARYLACQSCPDVVGAGTGCRHHKGCCFGTWRSKPGNRCPIGKW